MYTQVKYISFRILEHLQSHISKMDNIILGVVLVKSAVLLHNKLIQFSVLLHIIYNCVFV